MRYGWRFIRRKCMIFIWGSTMVSQKSCVSTGSCLSFYHCVPFCWTAVCCPPAVGCGSPGKIFWIINLQRQYTEYKNQFKSLLFSQEAAYFVPGISLGLELSPPNMFAKSLISPNPSSKHTFPRKRLGCWAELTQLPTYSRLIFLPFPHVSSPLPSFCCSPMSKCRL